MSDVTSDSKFPAHDVLGLLTGRTSSDFGGLVRLAEHLLEESMSTTGMAMCASQLTEQVRQRALVDMPKAWPADKAAYLLWAAVEAERMGPVEFAPKFTSDKHAEDWLSVRNSRSGR